MVNTLSNKVLDENGDENGNNETTGKHVILENERTLRLMIFSLTHHCGTQNPGVLMDVQGT